jgi:extradiol dioxygenase family protein
MPNLPPFHLAFPVRDLEQTHDFYTRILGCRTGRRSDTWIDFDLYGHQIVAHLAPAASQAHNPVDGHDVPVPHFGVILEWETWHRLAQQLREAGIEFVIEPYIRFAGQTGEQATMFFLDPSGNALEFKSFRDPAQIFAS